MPDCEFQWVQCHHANFDEVFNRFYWLWLKNQPTATVDPVMQEDIAVLHKHVCSHFLVSSLSISRKKMSRKIIPSISGSRNIVIWNICSTCFTFANPMMKGVKTQWRVAEIIFTDTLTYLSDNVLYHQRATVSSLLQFNKCTALEALKWHTATAQHFEQWDVSKWQLHLRSIWPRCIAMAFAFWRSVNIREWYRLQWMIRYTPINRPTPKSYTL
jgi:hypothetical protein